MKDGNGVILCFVYPANNPYTYICWVASDNSVYMYVGIVGWIFRTKIDPISILHPYPFHYFPFFSFHTEMIFPLLVPGLFFLSFTDLCIEFILLYVCRDSTDERRIVFQ